MSKKQKIKVPVILGPTAIGKTDISLRLARQLNFEIVSCDSRQIYKHMTIGTAKPTTQEMDEIKHWMIDIIDPSEYYSAHQFSQKTLEIIREGEKRDKTIAVCGGTGLYYRSLSEGLGPQVASNLPFREKYTKRALKQGNESIYRELQECDPETAAHVHPNDVQRVIRALQVYHDTGKPLSALQKKMDPPLDVEFFVIILYMSRPLLYKRINERVDAMFSAGLWDEFEQLLQKGYTKSDPGMQCVGYQELFDVKNTSKDLNLAIEKIKQNTRNYAKRQITWFTNKVTGTNIDISETEAYSLIKDMVRVFLRP